MNFLANFTIMITFRYIISVVFFVFLIYYVIFSASFFFLSDFGHYGFIVSKMREKWNEGGGSWRELVCCGC